MSKYRYRTPRLNWLTYLITTQSVMLGMWSNAAEARDYFNPQMLEIDNPHQGATDLSVFEEGSLQAPGIYRVDLYLNSEYQDSRDVGFRMLKDSSGKESLQPCLSVAVLNAIGVKTDLFPDFGDIKAECANLWSIPQASTEFRFNTQQLMLSIPQVAISQKARGYVAESQWDEGISAILLNYSVSGANNYARNNHGRDENSQYANLRPGINLGPWRLRNYTTYNRDSNNQSEWNTVYNYAQRNIIALKSKLSLGDSSSPTTVFDGVPFRGIQLSSDDDMLPDSMKGYAPVVRGIARTNAQVIIRQNGYVIYESYVAPGAFEINDMFPTGGSGDLYVTIKEADGSEQQLIVPFASLPVLQREGQVKFSITSGQYRSYDSSVDKTAFSQGTAIYGLPHGFTVYGGGQFSRPYQSLALGVGKNLGDIGAISTDVTNAWSTMKNRPKDSGQSWRIRYSKNILQTGTNFAIAGYRYSTDGYYGLQDVLDSYNNNQDSQLQVERRRNRSELNVSQSLWEGAGSLSLSLIAEDYWNTARSMRAVSASYSNSWKGISYGLNYSYNENSTQSSSSGSSSGKIYDRDQIFSFNISVPLNRLLGNTYATYNISTSRNGGTTNTVSLSGTTLPDDNLSWSAQQGYGSQGVGNSGSLSTNYRGTYGEANAGYVYDNNTQRLSYGLQGGVVAHQDGITLGQQMGETIALVKAPGAGGIRVINQTGVKTNGLGYAIVPYVNPYHKNQVQLDTATLPDNVDLTLTSQNVMPTRGAVVKANYEANVGRRMLMTLLRTNGSPVPFGSMVTDVTQKQKTTQGFIVGDEGQVYLTGMNYKGTLTAKWGNEIDQQCQVNYSIDIQAEEKSGIQTIQAKCK